MMKRCEDKWRPFRLYRTVGSFRLWNPETQVENFLTGKQVAAGGGETIIIWSLNGSMNLPPANYEHSVLITTSHGFPLSDSSAGSASSSRQALAWLIYTVCHVVWIWFRSGCVNKNVVMVRWSTLAVWKLEGHLPVKTYLRKLLELDNIYIY